MNKTTTILKNIVDFSKNESKILEELQIKTPPETSPSKKSIDFILNFSKAYSFRKSKTIGNFESLLN